MNMLLSDMNKGESALISSVTCDKDMKKRLHDMGLTKGARLKVKSKYMKEAVVLNIRGSRVVLGMAVADAIQVENVEQEEVPVNLQPGHRRFRYGYRKRMGGLK